MKLTRSQLRAFNSNKRKGTRKKRMDKDERKPYCTGCGLTFGQMHQLIQHRRIDRCGGRFLPMAERDMVNKLRLEREALIRRVRDTEKLEALHQ